MTKAEQFLWIVQTTIIANSVNLATRADADANRHVFSASGVLGTAGDAIQASARIPDDMTAAEAAAEFCGYMLENLRQKSAQVPGWFAN